VFTAACRLIERGETANCLTLRAQFDQDPALKDIGGGAYLAKLENAVVTIIGAEDYARVVRDLADRRRLIFACEDAIEAAYPARSTGANP
jgi:replicative DNA helicase